MTYVVQPGFALFWMARVCGGAASVAQPRYRLTTGLLLRYGSGITQPCNGWAIAESADSLNQRAVGAGFISRVRTLVLVRLYA